MRVLQLVDAWTGGGVPQVILNICSKLTEDDHQVRIASYQPVPEEKMPPDLVAEITSLRNPGQHPVKSVTALRSLLRSWQPDIIHDHYGSLWAMGYLFHRKWAHKSIYHVHNEFRVIPESPDADRPIRKNLFLSQVAPRYAKIVGISRHVSQTMREDTPAKKDQVRTVYNSIDVDDFLQRRTHNRPVRSDFDLQQYDLVIGTLGRFVMEKGFDTVVETLAELRSRNINSAALIVGEGDVRFEQEVSDLAYELGVADHCRFTGRQQGVVDFYRAMDAFLFCSRQEPFGLTLLEAMSAGTPIVATRQQQGGGPDEILSHKRNSLVSDKRSPQQLADHILELRSNNEIRERIITKGRRTAKDFNHDRMYRDLMKVYKELM